jgi:poly(3-hydroxybutyrate) depolymerase
MILHFHGQGVSPPLQLGDPDTSEYDLLAEKQGFMHIMGYPLGLGDGNCGVGWNVLDQNASLKDTCTSTAWQTGQTCCYQSCKQLGKCAMDLDLGPGYCGWSTCHNDVLFVRPLLPKLKALFTVDTSKLFVTGASNGGMFMHFLLSKLPNTFTSAAAAYAEPLTGMLDVPAALKRTSILQVHGRQDVPRWNYFW